MLNYPETAVLYGWDEISAATGKAKSTLIELRKRRDPSLPIYFIGKTPYMAWKTFLQQLGVKPEPKEPDPEMIDAAVKRVLKERFGGG